MTPMLRPARSDDIDRMRAIELDAGHRFRSVGLNVIADHPPSEEAVLQRHVSAGTAWVAVVDGEIVGFATGSVVDGEGHLEQVSLISAAAGHGIGRALIDEVVEWARSRGLLSITLTTFRDVPWNGPYYRRLGFVDLTDEESGPELLRIREAERAAGVDVAPRIAMRSRLLLGVVPTQSERVRRASRRGHHPVRPRPIRRRSSRAAPDRGRRAWSASGSRGSWPWRGT